MNKMIQRLRFHLHDYLAELARVTQRFRAPVVFERLTANGRLAAPVWGRTLLPVPNVACRALFRSGQPRTFRYSLAFLCLAVLSGHFLQSPALAQAITCRASSATRFFGDSPTNGDFFGTAVALSGDVAVVGAPSEDNACPEDLDCNSGAAYVFRWDGAQWVKTQRLLPSDGAAADRFGWAVAVDGSRIVVGAPQCTAVTSDPCSRAGTAYVFEFDAGSQTWLQSAKLTPADGQARDRFGEALALSGDVILIGAPGADGIDETNKGAAYVYRFSPSLNSWIQEDRLIPPDPAFRYAESLALDGDVAVIGAAGDDSLNPGNPLCMTGSAFVYAFNSGTGEWIELQKLTASDAFCENAGGSQFGTSVAVDGDAIIVGAEEDDHDGPASGSAYAFRLDGTSGLWMEEQKLVAPDTAEESFYGHAVSLNGNLALIGAPGRSFGPSAAGAAYLIRYGPGFGWFLDSQARLEAATKGQGTPDYFGGSLAMDGDRAWFGARNDGSLGPQAGAAYVVRGLTSDCNTNGTADLCDIATETSQDCNGNGVPDECDIVSGFSLDLDTNGVPDECDPDCNGNNIPDVLDIASGFSTDCNGNGVPDECDSGLLETTLATPDSGTAGQFGFAVAASGDVAVVGAPYENNSQGAAYVFRYNGLSWVREAKLVASDGQSNDVFGACVAIEGSFIAVGSPGDDNSGFGSNDGSVYLFERGDLSAGWVERIRIPDPESNDDGAAFGSRVSLDGQVLLVGADGSSIDDLDVGAAYVFRYDQPNGQWNPEPKLTADDGARFDFFGYALDLGGDVAVIANAREAAYVFRYDSGSGSWNQEDKLVSQEPGNGFAWAVAVQGDRIVVSAERSVTEGIKTGAAFVFEYDPASQTWPKAARLVPSDGASDDSFGTAVAISDETIAVSAALQDEATNGAGAAYVFRWNDGLSAWTEEQKWVAPAAEVFEEAGNARALALTPGIMVIGAIGTPSSPFDKAYLVSGVAGGDTLPPRGCEQCATVAIEDPHQTPDDEFGDAVAIANGWLAVGAPFNDEACPNSLPCNAGAVDLYHATESGWVYTVQLTATNASIAAQFGWSLAMDGDLLLVGARYQDGVGAGYVFRQTNDTWMEQAKLSAPDVEVGDEVGFAVALDGDVAVLGNPEDADLGNRTGAAYVFRYDGSTWVFEHRLIASDRGPGESFGRCVAVDGDTIAVGVPEKDYSGELNVGAVYLYEYDVGSGIWMEQRALMAPDFEGSGAFGQTLALRGDNLLVGAPSDGPAGATYIFQRNGGIWEFQNKFQPRLDATPNAGFGAAVALSDGLAFVGAPMERDPDTTAFQGALYAYYLDGNRWRGLTKFSPFDAVPPHNFGATIAADGDLVAGGAPRSAGYIASMNCHRLFIREQMRPLFGFIEIVGNEARLRWSGRAGVHYTLERAPALTGPWIEIESQTASGAPQDFRDVSLPGGTDQAFYRLRSETLN